MLSKEGHNIEKTDKNRTSYENLKAWQTDRSIGTLEVYPAKLHQNLMKVGKEIAGSGMKDSHEALNAILNALFSMVDTLCNRQEIPRVTSYVPGDQVNHHTMPQVWGGKNAMGVIQPDPSRRTKHPERTAGRPSAALVVALQGGLEGRVRANR